MESQFYVILNSPIEIQQGATTRTLNSRGVNFWLVHVVTLLPIKTEMAEERSTDHSLTLHFELSLRDEFLSRILDQCSSRNLTNLGSH